MFLEVSFERADLEVGFHIIADSESDSEFVFVKVGFFGNKKV
jgi:hypothetical protein